MKLFKSLFSKKTKQTVRVVDNDINFYVVNWDKHETDINALITEMEEKDAFSKEYKTTRLPCVIKPEPDNEYDKNAMLVLVKCPKGKTWYTVGYVPRDKCMEAKRGNKFVNNKTHYWNCRLTYSKATGTKFNVYLAKSQYQ